MRRYSRQKKTLEGWLGTALGQAFILMETNALETVITKLFGYHFLVIGEYPFVNCLLKSVIPHRVWLHPSVKPSEQVSGIVSRQDKLPIRCDGIDHIYLAHCLEFIKNPHEVLREAYRSLRAEGTVLITGFNPWSIWGIYRFLIRYVKKASWDGQFISVFRLKDWLSLLGFEVLDLHYYGFRPPIHNPKILRRLSFLEKVGKYCWPFWGASYLIVANKKVATLTPIKPQWSKPKIVTERIVEPVISKAP